MVFPTPPSSVLSPFYPLCPPRDPSTFFFLFFSFSSSLTLWSQVVSSSSRALCLQPVESLSSGMRESRGGGVQARVCVGTHRGMRDSVAMELPAKFSHPPASPALNPEGF